MRHRHLRPDMTVLLAPRGPGASTVAEWRVCEVGTILSTIWTRPVGRDRDTVTLMDLSTGETVNAPGKPMLGGGHILVEVTHHLNPHDMGDSTLYRGPLPGGDRVVVVSPQQVPREWDADTRRDVLNQRAHERSRAGAAAELRAARAANIERITGQAVSIDPATGAVTLPAEDLVRMLTVARERAGADPCLV